jgi:hypothetical protein
VYQPDVVADPFSIKTTILPDDESFEEPNTHVVNLSSKKVSFVCTAETASENEARVQQPAKTQNTFWTMDFQAGQFWTNRTIDWTNRTIDGQSGWRIWLMDPQALFLHTLLACFQQNAREEASSVPVVDYLILHLFVDQLIGTEFYVDMVVMTLVIGLFTAYKDREITSYILSAIDALMAIFGLIRWYYITTNPIQ